MQNLICGREIRKSYGPQEKGKHYVLDGVSLEIGYGEFVSVMGPSGSGKSTLLYALSGMDCVESGSVVFDGQEYSGMSDEQLSGLRRNRMGFVFQQPTLLKNLNLLDNIILPAARESRRNMGGLVERARELMKQMGIEELAERGISQVSGGQLQRAGICRALMSRPEIIFGDEATGALNSRAAQEVMELFQKVNEGGTAVLLVTHDVNVAAGTRRVLFMKDGKIAGELAFSESDSSGKEKRVERILLQMRNFGI